MRLQSNQRNPHGWKFKQLANGFESGLRWRSSSSRRPDPPATRVADALSADRNKDPANHCQI